MGACLGDLLTSTTEAIGELNLIRVTVVDLNFGHVQGQLSLTFPLCSDSFFCLPLLLHEFLTHPKHLISINLSWQK